ncbi:MAG: iron hydrogenase [Patescibacteria group bacterium]
MKEYQSLAKTIVMPEAATAVKFLSLAVLATFLPFFIHLQWITGPLVNAVLIVALFLVGIRSALIIALIPSVIALSSGLLPALLAPIVPFIMVSNVILVLSVDQFYARMKNNIVGYWTGVGVGAVLKFAFLFLSVDIISDLLLKQHLAAKVAQMMSWPQLATALAGGFIAWILLRYFGEFEKKYN